MFVFFHFNSLMDIKGIKLSGILLFNFYQELHLLLESKPFLLFTFQLFEFKLHKLGGDFVFIFGKSVGNDNLQNIISGVHFAS